MRRLVRSGQMVRWRGKHVVLAFPLELGSGLADAGEGNVYRVDVNGNYVFDENGNPVIDQKSET